MGEVEASEVVEVEGVKARGDPMELRVCVTRERWCPRP